MTGIQWTDATWNPVTGCTKVSPGCAHCYIERTPPFRMAGRRFVKGKIPVQLHHDRLWKPLRWRKPRRVFVCSMSDLFHEDVPDSFLLEVWMTMALSPEHTYQVLTKRPERMRDWIGGLQKLPGGHQLFDDEMWPLPNVWLGVSAENQETADQRIPILLETPAAKRFVSCEPLLGPLDLTAWLPQTSPHPGGIRCGPLCGLGLSWVIVGGESGGSPERALVERCDNWRHGGEDGGPHRAICTGWRPKPEPRLWVRSIREQCAAAGVPLFVKQWGGPTPKAGGRTLDGRTWDEFPERQAVLA